MTIFHNWNCLLSTFMIYKWEFQTVSLVRQHGCTGWPGSILVLIILWFQHSKKLIHQKICHFMFPLSDWMKLTFDQLCKLKMQISNKCMIFRICEIRLQCNWVYPQILKCTPKISMTGCTITYENEWACWVKVKYHALLLIYLKKKKKIMTL